MNEAEFWIAFWRIVAVALSVLIVTIGSCVSYQTNTVAQMTQNGAKPLDAACAISLAPQIVCQVWVAK